MSEVRSDVVGPAAWLTMTNPSKANARDASMRAALRSRFAALVDDEAVGAVVLTGEGDRAFCAGGDIDAFPDTFEDGYRLAREAFDGFADPHHFPKPVIGAVNGAAIGGGTELTLACDVVLAVEHATFGLPEAHLGIMPPYGIVRLCSRIGELHALDLLLTGRHIDAEEALRMGLVTAVVPAGELRDEAQRWAVQVSSLAAPAVGAMKAVLATRDSAAAPLATALTAALFTTDEARRRIDGFRQRRDEEVLAR